MFYRDILKELDEWSQRANRKPLVLRGARQVGKTTLVELFSKKFSTYLYLNLEKAEDRAIFETDNPFSSKLDAIFFLKRKQKAESNILIFIDEIQNSPRAIALLRYFYEEAPHIHVIAAGSLLESLIDRHISFPVGRVEYLAVRPCSFNEFLNAAGETLALNLIRQWPFPEYAHNQVQKLFNVYTLIGGMPGVVANYVSNFDLVALNPEYQSLLVGYMDDVEKYVSRNNAVQHIRHILRTGFRYGGQRIKFERFGESDYRSREMGEAFRTLEKAMIIELVYPTSSVQIPYLPDFKKSPRLQWLDTGLLNYHAGIQNEVFVARDINSAWKGLTAEHIVGQELVSNNYNVLAHRIFWVRDAKNSNAEIDYLFPYEGLLIPLEIKSDAGTTLKSLHLFMDAVNHHLAVRIWSKPFLISDIRTLKGKTFKLVSIPFYLVSQLKEIINRMIN